MIGDEERFQELERRLDEHQKRIDDLARRFIPVSKGLEINSVKIIPFSGTINDKEPA